MPTKAARLDSWLRDRAPAQVDLAAFDELLRLLTPISESALRRLLRSSAASLHPLVAGVNQDSWDTLRDSLLSLALCYENGTPDSRRLIRRIVITAKDHAKLAAGNQRVAPAKREVKQEMTAWMLTWLENPAVFPLWVRLREKSRELD